MPLLQRDKNKLSIIKPAKFQNEKELQFLIETNLEEIFNAKFIASEFSTGPVHGGRIDTLALSEDNNPVIIEYKVQESSQLVNQSLYYLSWINDHRGDFEICVQKKFQGVEIDWSIIRVICIAPEYKKYDLHAVQIMGANIELWQYRYFENGIFFLEEIYKRSFPVSSQNNEINLSNKNPIMVEAGRKGALTRATGVYSLEQHLEKIDESKKDLLLSIKDFILSLDESIEEVPKKFYIAYKISQNFACMEVFKTKIVLYLKVDPKLLNPLPINCRNVEEIGHYGTGSLEVTIKSEEDFINSKELIITSLNNIGGI